MSSKKEVSLQIEHFSPGQDVEFLIKSKKEMRFILQDIAEKGTRVALYYDEDQNFIPTTLIGANEDGMWLEIGPSPQENKRILLSHKIIVVSKHQNVKVQFVAPRVVKTMLDGDETFYVDMPDYLLRIQRRNYFRLNVPASSPLSCLITVKPVDPDKPDEPGNVRNVPIIDIKAPAMNISGGGISLLCGEHETELLPGRVFQDCRISLPGIGTIRVDIEVRNSIKFTSRNGSVNTHVGCQFGRMDNQTSSLLQSYITRLQSESMVKGLSNNR